jgi:hypothetical protein
MLKFNENILKKEACIKIGINFEFLIFDKSGNIIDENKIMK